MQKKIKNLRVSDWEKKNTCKKAQGKIIIDAGLFKLFVNEVNRSSQIKKITDIRNMKAAWQIKIF